MSIRQSVYTTLSFSYPVLVCVLGNNNKLIFIVVILLYVSGIYNLRKSHIYNSHYDGS